MYKAENLAKICIIQQKYLTLPLIFNELAMKYFFLCIFSVLSLLIYAQESDTILLKGKATYYSLRMHGRGTSSGEMYNKDSLICAHRTLPFGTRLRVINTGNGKEIMVRVVDRGPFVKKYVLDLSTAAARDLGFLGQGIANIEYCVLGPGPVYKMTPAEREAARKAWQAKHGTSKKKAHRKSSRRKSKRRR